MVTGTADEEVVSFGGGAVDVSFPDDISRLFFSFLTFLNVQNCGIL